MVVELLLLAASGFLLVVYFCSVESTVSYLKPQSSASQKPTHISTSLPDGLQAVLMHTTDFVYEGIESSRVHTDTSIRKFINQTEVSNFALPL